jgi:hypothetical protein
VAVALSERIPQPHASEAEGDLLDLMEELRLPAAPIAGRKKPSRALAELRADER